MPNTSAPSNNNPVIRPSVQLSSSQRSPADTVRQNGMFRKELDRLAKPEEKSEREKKNGSEKADETENPSGMRRQSGLEGRGRRGGKGDGDEQKGGEFLSDAMTNAMFRAGKLANMQKISGPELPAEHLARIAAAIQELASNGVNTSYQLQLPLGNALIEGAILGRDANGNLAIQLISSGSLSSGQAAQLREELLRRLEKKRIKIVQLELSTGHIKHPDKSGGNA
jgi:hypothetical protein